MPLSIHQAHRNITVSPACKWISGPIVEINCLQFFAHLLLGTFEDSGGCLHGLLHDEILSLPGHLLRLRPPSPTRQQGGSGARPPSRKPSLARMDEARLL